MARGRKYIPAVFDPDHAPGTSPKVSGGYEVDTRGNQIPTRGFNRPDQRYTLDPLEAQSRRATRAASEQETTAIYTVSDTMIEVRTVTGNFYRLPNDTSNCSCPDQFRLTESYPDIDVMCKHRIMAHNAIGDGTVDDLPWGTVRLAGYIGGDKRTVESAIKRAELTATKINNVYVVDSLEAVTWGEMYRDKIVQFDASYGGVILP